MALIFIGTTIFWIIMWLAFKPSFEKNGMTFWHAIVVGIISGILVTLSGI